MAALARLQSLACVGAIDFDIFPNLLRGMHEQARIEVLNNAFIICELMSINCLYIDINSDH